MKILFVGKFPPIQGGVSAQNFELAHSMAKIGHEVHVVTNAKETANPFHVFMRAEDWAFCEQDYEEGCLKVHWTQPPDQRQGHIPFHNPFVTKLASLALKVASQIKFDLIYSFYLEPYAVAGHVVSQALDIPHVVKTAGSDIGRLWEHEQLQPLYLQIFKDAAGVITGWPGRQKLIEAGVQSEVFRLDPGVMVQLDLFNPEGDLLDVRKLLDDIRAKNERFAPLLWGEVDPEIPYIGIYGKIGKNKGTYQLLDALAQVRDKGIQVGLLVMAHGFRESGEDFRSAAKALNLEDTVVQLPFLPHWRVPEFIRRCVAVCCLEQDFPIAIHRPVIAREVMACGATLIASTEVLQKLPLPDRIIDRYNCVAIDDVNNTIELAEKIEAVISRPDFTKIVGARARIYVHEAQKNLGGVEKFEKIFHSCVSGAVPENTISKTRPSEDRKKFELTELALEVLDEQSRNEVKDICKSMEGTREWVKEITKVDKAHSDVLKAAAKLESWLDKFLKQCNTKRVKNSKHKNTESIFRLKIYDWALSEKVMSALVPQHYGHLEIQKFDFDVTLFMSAYITKKLPKKLNKVSTYLVLQFSDFSEVPKIISLDGNMGDVLCYCDGKLSIAGVSDAYDGACDDNQEVSINGYMEQLLCSGLISLGIT